MNTIYISGPISGRPNLNREAFAEAAKKLEAAGFKVINPHHLGDKLLADRPGLAALPEQAQWLEFMRCDIKALVDCDAVFMLQGWEQSRGARLEHVVAEGLGLAVLFEAIAAEVA